MSNDVVCIDLNDGNKIPAIGYGTWEVSLKLDQLM